MKTAVEWLEEQTRTPEWHSLKRGDIFQQAKTMEKEQSHEYAEFAIRCDRVDMKILNFEDYLKLENFKSE